MKYLLCGINAKYIHSNLAIFCLSAYAGRYGPQKARYLIREYTINHRVEDILQDLYEAGADVLIFSCYIWNISYVRELAEEMKKLCPDLSIWVGGPEVSYDAIDFLKSNPAVDLVMQGEGEEQFTGLVRLWEERGDYFSVRTFDPASDLALPPGVVVRKRESLFLPLCERDTTCAMASATEDPAGTGLFSGSGQAPPVDMDKIPFVYENFHLFEHKILYYESSRGCPFRCSYCLSSIDRRVRFRSLSLVLPELVRFLDAEVPQVKFVDRTFNCNKDHAMAIWTFIRDHDNGITNFHFEIAADLLTEEEMELFSTMRPGLIQLEIGVQSTHGPTIAAIRRQMDLEAVFANVDRIRAMGNIHQHIDLIAGLPYEDYGQFATSFNDLYAHCPDQLQLGFLKVLKGTFMEEKQEEYGLVCRSMPPYEVLGTRWLRFDEIIRLKGVEEMVETYYNSMQFTFTLRYAVPLFPTPFAFYLSLFVWYKNHGYDKMNHSRMEKYEILREFLLGTKTGGAFPEIPLLNELLLLDMYLREKLKKRPPWAPDQSGFRREMKKIYQDQGENLFPRLWRAGRYDSRKAEYHSHIEKFTFNVEHFMRGGIPEQGECLILFDYTDRDSLTYNAATHKINRICVGE